MTQVVPFKVFHAGQSACVLKYSPIVLPYPSAVAAITGKYIVLGRFQATFDHGKRVIV